MVLGQQIQCEGCLEYFFPTPMPEPPQAPPPPSPLSSPCKRHDFDILAPKIKILAPKFKYLVPKSQNVALNSNDTDRIQITQDFVPLKTSRFVREKLPTQLI
jgi:hypothetical protein